MSGERYHSVTTSLVYLPMRTARKNDFFTGMPDDRARPKSPSFSSPSLLIRRFCGLRSLGVGDKRQNYLWRMR